jgi:hypothetical protein
MHFVVCESVSPYANPFLISPCQSAFEPQSVPNFASRVTSTLLSTFHQSASRRLSAVMANAVLGFPAALIIANPACSPGIRASRRAIGRGRIRGNYSRLVGAKRMRFKRQRAGRCHGLDSGFAPPPRFVAAAMHLTVVSTA